MSLFVDNTNSHAFLKLGIMGFAGSGKTFTATGIAAGLIDLMRTRDIEAGAKPLYFFDTETGSDWVRDRLAECGIEMRVAKTRSFSDLMQAIPDAEANASFMIIDSVTHIWRDLCESYLASKNRSSGRLEFQDWAVLKDRWGKFTDAFVNSQLHMAICGRAGFEYDMSENEEGKKQLEKTGVKMKAEGEMGYEPDLLIHMERKTKPEDLNKVYRLAHVLKDRSDRLDGLSFENPTFENFVPHIMCLNLGGEQLGIKRNRNSEDQFDDDSSAPRWQIERRQKQIALDEIKEEIGAKWPGRSAAEIAKKSDFCLNIFGTRSWTKIETMRVEEIERARNAVWQELRGCDYGDEMKPKHLIQKGDDEGDQEPIPEGEGEQPEPGMNADGTVDYGHVNF